MFHDDGADDAQPFDFAAAPVLLCSRDPWQRNTPGNSYSDGSRFWKGMAALLGVAQLKRVMKDIYITHKGNPVSTAMIEEFLLCKSGNPQVVDAFHRFVYGLANPSPAPDLWLRDDPADAGADSWGGTFWNSPDLWIRNTDDGGTTHQSPEYGQDNWFHARVRNKASAGAAPHFVVTFHSKGFAGTQFLYPSDFLPCIAARGRIRSGVRRHARSSRRVAARAGAARGRPHLFAGIGHHSIRSSHRWPPRVGAQQPGAEEPHRGGPSAQHLHDPAGYCDQLAPPLQTRVRVGGDPIRVGPVRGQPDPPDARKCSAAPDSKPKPFNPFAGRPVLAPQTVVLECGGRVPGAQSSHRGRVLTSATPDLIHERYPQSWEVAFPAKGTAPLTIDLQPFDQTVVGLKIAVPQDAMPGQVIRFHFVQRSLSARRIVGGVAVQIKVAKPDETLATPREKTL